MENDRRELHKLNSEWAETKKTREDAEAETQKLKVKIEAILKKYRVYPQTSPIAVCSAAEGRSAGSDFGRCQYPCLAAETI